MDSPTLGPYLRGIADRFEDPHANDSPASSPSSSPSPLPPRFAPPSVQGSAAVINTLSLQGSAFAFSTLSLQGSAAGPVDPLIDPRLQGSAVLSGNPFLVGSAVAPSNPFPQGSAVPPSTASSEGSASPPKTPSPRLRNAPSAPQGSIARKAQRLKARRTPRKNADLQSSAGQMPPTGPRPQAHPHVINQQQIQQQREMQMQHQIALRRSRKPTDLEIPDGIEDVNPLTKELVAQYKELQAAERKLDATMLRKTLDMQERLHQTCRIEGKLRITVTNTVENQPWQQPDLAPETFNFETGEDASYRLVLDAKLLDDDDWDEEEYGPKPVETQAEKDTKCLSYFFKKISFDIERPMGEPVLLAEWKKLPNAEPTSSLSIRRKGDETFSVVISLYRDEDPERFRLSQALIQAIDQDEGDRVEVLQWVWEYAKFFGLIDDEEKRRIRCDDSLKKVFGVDMVYFHELPERIIPHLHPLDPHKLRYTVRLDPEFDGSSTIYEVRVALADPIKPKIREMLYGPKQQERLRQIAAIDDQLAITMQQLHRSKARHSFFGGFAKDPVDFTKKWLASQQRDLDIILGERGEKSGSMEFEKGGPDGAWNSEIVREAVQNILNKQPRF